MRHLIESNDFTKQELLDLIDLADNMIENPRQYAESCRGKQLATLFYEPSTRTRLSFTSAMLSLGGSVFGFSDANSSSVSKGETVADTTRIISQYADIIAMRHHKEGAAFVAAQYSLLPVINAGDGSHAHPTQTLTDIFTIHRELGRLDNLTIGLCGDLKYGRTVHSLMKAMTLFDNVHFILIASDRLPFPTHILDECKMKISYSESPSIEEAIDKCDVLYMTRVQQERFDDLAEYEACKSNFILTYEKLQQAKKEMIVLHPLPRVDEISSDVDDDPRAAYFRQAKNGKFIRMALIHTLLTHDFYSKSKHLENNLIETPQPCLNKKCITQTEAVERLGYVDNLSNHRCAYCDEPIK